MVAISGGTDAADVDTGAKTGDACVAVVGVSTAAVGEAGVGESSNDADAAPV